MVNSKCFGEDKKKVCLDLQNLTNSNHVPLSVYCKPLSQWNTSPFMSLQFHITVYWEESLCRMTPQQMKWTKRSCIHKYIAKWHLFQTHHELFRKVRSTEEVAVLTSAGEENRHDEADLGDIPYPPKDNQKFKVMVQYILKNKTLPVVLPEHLRLPSVEMSQHCPGNVPLSDPILIIQKPKILTSSRIVHGNSVM